MALGNALREARLRRKLTATEVAAGTRMKTQVVEALENEDFSAFSAPIYGKGFIKLYAEYVGLDPRPLVAEYTGLLSAARPLPAARAVAPASHTPVPPPAEEAAGPAAGAGDDDLFARLNRRTGAEAEARWSTGGRGRPNARVVALGTVIRDAAARAAAACRGALGRAALPARRPAGGPKAPPENEVAEGAAPAAPLRLHLFPIVLGIIVVLVFVISGLSRCIATPRPDQTGQPDAKARLQIAVDPPDPYID